ncbi:MAG: hypothetical protein IKW53_04710, partial [Clostridia bacterium]|nr:hypothetical protein [Clostridia bacterium]
MIKTDIKLPYSYTTEDIYSALIERLPIDRSEVRDMKIVKRTLNISDKNNIHYTATIALDLSA